MLVLYSNVVTAGRKQRKRNLKRSTGESAGSIVTTAPPVNLSQKRTLVGTGGGGRLLEVTLRRGRVEEVAEEMKLKVTVTPKREGGGRGRGGRERVQSPMMTEGGRGRERVQSQMMTEGGGGGRHRVGERVRRGGGGNLLVSQKTMMLDRQDTGITVEGRSRHTRCLHATDTTVQVINAI